MILPNASTGRLFFFVFTVCGMRVSEALFSTSYLHTKPCFVPVNDTRYNYVFCNGLYKKL